LLLMGRSRYPRGLTREAAAHITSFSLGGLEGLAAARRAQRAGPEALKTPLRSAQRAV
jgi:hypothetical protein